MPITHVIDGEEVTLYTPEEMEQATTEKTRLEQENERLARENKEKANNFRRLNQMTEAEKDQFTATEMENRTMIEKLMDEKNALVEQLTQKEKESIDKARDNLIKEYVGDNEELKNKFLEKYSIVNIDEKDPESVRMRGEAAATLAGIQIPEAFDPTRAMWNGDAPRPLKGDTEEFLKSDKFKAAQAAMGLPVEENK